MANYDTITNMLRKMQETNQASGQMMLEKAKIQGQGMEGLVQGMRDVGGIFAAKNAQERMDEAEMERQRARTQAEQNMAGENLEAQKLIAEEREKTTRGDIRYKNFPPSGDGSKDKRLTLSPTANQVLKEIGGDKYVTYDSVTGMEKLNYDALIKDKDIILQRAKLQLDNMVTAGLESAQAENTLRELELALQGQQINKNDQSVIPGQAGQIPKDTTAEQVESFAKRFLSLGNRPYQYMTDQIKSGNVDAANKSSEVIKTQINSSNLPEPVKQGLLDQLIKALADLTAQTRPGMGPPNTRPR